MTVHHSLKTLGLAAGAAAAAFSIAQAAPVFNSSADVKAITAIEEDLQTQIDLKPLLHYYAPDAISFDMFAPGVYKGKAAIYKGIEWQFGSIQSMTHTFPEMNVATDGKLACVAMQIHFDVTDKSGKTTATNVREIDAFKKIDGKWRLIEQHISLPADAKTGMAVFSADPVVHGPMDWSSNPIPGAAVSPAVAKAEIRHWMDVGTLSTNIDQLMTYYGPGDDTLVYDTFAPGNLRGRQQIRDYYAPFMGSYKGVKVKMPVFADDSDGSFGVQIDTQDMELVMNDGSKKYISLRQSDCMRRVHGKWYSFFEMISYPVDAKTGKSVMANPGAF